MPPRIAVNMMVLNAATVLPRCLRSMRGAVDELVVVDTGSDDDTQEVVESLADELGVDRLYYERLHPLGPNFFTDEAASFRLPLPGPFTGRRIPTDWAAVRNLALDNTTADYVIKLDADDESLLPPENWRGTADYLEAHPELLVVAAPYEVYDGKGAIEWLSMYDRMFRRVPADDSSPPRWRQPCHEYLHGKNTANTLYNVQGLRVRDWRDSPGAGVRVADRNLKVLLRAFEQGERRTISSPEDLQADLVERFTLGHEAAEVLPEFAMDKLAHVLERLDPSDTPMRSDCYYHLGRANACLGATLGYNECFQRAATYYLLADGEHPHLQALLRLYEIYVGQGAREEAAAVVEVKKKVLSRLGTAPAGTLAFNCDLKLLAALRGGTP